MAVVLRRSTTDPLVSQQAFTATCAPSDNVGNLVSIDGAVVNGVYQVMSVDITDFNMMPAIGIIIKKDSPTSCVVQRFGTVSNVGLSSLQPGKRCFVGFDSRPTNTPPLAVDSTTGFAMIQPVGIAIGATSIELVPTLHMTRVRI